MPMSPEQHAEHMQKVSAGLQQIMQSNDINEAHQIAQSLLAEEESEMQADNAQEGAPNESFEQKLMRAKGVA